MRRAVMLTVLAAAAAGPASAQAVLYQGVLSCEAVPSANLPASTIRATITRRGNQVTFERPVFNPQTAAVVGRETGTGTLSAGRFVIETETDLAGNMVRARYEGTLTDAEVRLNGTRRLMLRAAVGSQACSGTFRPQRG